MQFQGHARRGQEGRATVLGVDVSHGDSPDRHVRSRFVIPRHQANGTGCAMEQPFGRIPWCRTPDSTCLTRAKDQDRVGPGLLLYVV